MSPNVHGQNPRATASQGDRDLPGAASEIDGDRTGLLAAVGENGFHDLRQACRSLFVPALRLPVPKPLFPCDGQRLARR